MEDFTIEALEGRYLTYDPRNHSKPSSPDTSTVTTLPTYYSINGGKKHQLPHVCAYLFATHFAPSEAPPAITIKTAKLLDTIPAAENLPCKVPFIPPEPSEGAGTSPQTSSSNNSSSISSASANSNAFKGLLITTDRRSFTLIRNCDCARWSFPDYDTFQKMGFKGQHAVVLEADDLSLIPIGGTLPSLQNAKR
jgi:hypothetical protein